MRKGALAALVALALIAACKPRPKPGVTYDFTTSLTGASKGRELSGRAAVAGDFMALEFDQGDGVTTHERSIYLSRDAGETYVILQPDKKNYYEVTADQAADRMSRVLSMAMEKMNLRITNARSRVIDEGRGTKIDGYSTRKYNHSMSYDMTMSLGGQTIAASTNVKSRIWTTDMFSERYFQFLRKQQARTGIPEIDARLASDIAKVKGFPLRQVVETSVTANQMTQHSRADMRVSNIRHTDIPGERFEIPDDYEKVDPPSLDLSTLMQLGRQMSN